jgi:hypothetical protein
MQIDNLLLLYSNTCYVVFMNIIKGLLTLYRKTLALVWNIWALASSDPKLSKLVPILYDTKSITLYYY